MRASMPRWPPRSSTITARSQKAIINNLHRLTNRGEADSTTMKKGGGSGLPTEIWVSCDGSTSRIDGFPAEIRVMKERTERKGKSNDITEAYFGGGTTKSSSKLKLKGKANAGEKNSITDSRTSNDNDNDEVCDKVCDEVCNNIAPRKRKQEKRSTESSNSNTTGKTRTRIRDDSRKRKNDSSKANTTGDVVNPPSVDWIDQMVSTTTKQMEQVATTTKDKFNLQQQCYESQLQDFSPVP